VAGGAPGISVVAPCDTGKLLISVVEVLVVIQTASIVYM
jgi:hypothetical protein